MSENTKIEWCDHTFNPWTGCTKVSPGCDHCYAEGWSKRAGDKVGKWGQPIRKWQANAYAMVKVGKKVAGRQLDGIEHNGFPGGAV